MITWTSSGAVERPKTVQIRVQRSYPGRIRAGAPVPTRSMSEDELIENIRFFTKEDPRAFPCTGLVLSGVGVTTREDIPDLIKFSRDRGINRVILHVGGEDLENFNVQPWQNLVDVLVVPIQPVEVEGGLSAGAKAVTSCQDFGLKVAVNTVLNSRAIEKLLAVARAISRIKPDEVTFTYPFPINGSESNLTPPIARTVKLLTEAIEMLERASIRPRIKGLPACYLGEHYRLLGRSYNRFYVDADHQLNEALYFFPDVVSFQKEEICRFCSQDQNCDGFFATYLRRSGFPPLEPL